MTTASSPPDPLGALVCETPDVDAAEDGPLAGWTFAAKDLFDVAGYPTRAGNPDYAAWRGPPEKHAWAVRALAEAGARLVAKTHTHELAYGLTGVNPHFGTPRNPHDGERIAGGSSSGSAAAVGDGMVPVALGSDTAGSIRLPASLCGLASLRPTHGRIPLDGVVPLAPSFDTVGLLARDADGLRRASQTLLGSSVPEAARHGFRRADVVADAGSIAEDAALQAVDRARGRLESLGLAVEETTFGHLEAMRTVQAPIGGAQIWSVHERWLTEREPELGWDVATKLEAARRLTVAEIGRALAQAPELVRDWERRLADGATVAVLPAAPGVAPRVEAVSDREGATAFRRAVLALVTPASLGGLPVVTVPSVRVAGLPVGVQLIGPRGSDERLLALAAAYSHQGEFHGTG